MTTMDSEPTFRFLPIAGALMIQPMMIDYRVKASAGVETAHPLARFGDTYRQYMAHTGRFLPAPGAGTSNLSHSRA